MKRVFAALIHLYRIAVSPFLAPRCRFLPTCSEYALEALERHGAFSGGWLALRRIARCHPFHPGGIDEVPVRLSPICRCRWPSVSRSERTTER